MTRIFTSFLTLCLMTATAHAETAKAPTVLELQGENAPDKPAVKSEPKVLKLEGANAPDKTFTDLQLVAIPMLAGTTIRATTWDDVEAQLFVSYQRADRLGTGISKKSQDKKQLIDRAKRRARLIGKWMIYDLDGDGDVSMDEMRVLASRPLQANRMSFQPTPEQTEEMLQSLIRQMKVPDLDNNGVFEFTEMLAEAERLSTKSRAASSAIGRQRQLAETYIVFDQNGDGRTTQSEYMAGMRTIFDAFDKDRDMTLSELEKQQIQTARREVSTATRSKR